MKIDKKQYLSEEFKNLVLTSSLKDAISIVTNKQKGCDDWVVLSELDNLIREKIMIEAKYYKIPEKYREEVDKEVSFRSYSMYSIIMPEIVNYQLYHDIILEHSNKYAPKKIWYKHLIEKIREYSQPSEFRMEFYNK